MLKCGVCGKKITNKEYVRFDHLYGIFPRVYCNNKCSSKQIRGFDELASASYRRLKGHAKNPCVAPFGSQRGNL